MILRLMMLVKRPFCIPVHMVVAGSGWLSRILNAVMQLLTIRILLPELGTDQYAVFVLLTSVMGWFMLADLGLGNSLQNFIAEQRGRGEEYDVYLALSGLLSVLLVTISLIVIYCLRGYLGIILLKNFSFLTNSERIKLVLTVSYLAVITNVGGIIYKIWYAEQRGYIANLLPTITTLLGVIGVLYVKSRVTHSSVMFWTLFSYLFPAAAIVTCSYVWKLRNIRWLKVMRQRDILVKLVNRAVKFWFYALMAAATLQIDYLVLSQYINSREIVAYSITMKIFGFAAYVYGAVLLAMMPVITERLSVMDYGVLSMVWRNLRLGLIFMVVMTVIVATCMKFFLKVVAPGQVVDISLHFIILVGLYQVIRTWTDTFAIILQGISYMRPFFIWVPVQAFITALLTFSLAPHIGIDGVIIGINIAFLLTVSWALPYFVKKRLMEIKAG